VAVFPIRDSRLLIEVDVTTLQPVEAAIAPLLIMLQPESLTLEAPLDGEDRDRALRRIL
jgi:hypothetical protein